MDTTQEGKSIKDHKTKDATMLRKYFISIINNTQENTRDRNEAAKNLARLQHLLQVDKTVVKQSQQKEGKKDLTEEDQVLIHDLMKYGEIDNGNIESDEPDEADDSEESEQDISEDSL